jgi:hypothetical protein
MRDDQLAELDALPTDELRKRAFHLAEERLDVPFFWSLFKHLPSSDDAEAVDGSTGSYGAGIDDFVQLWEQWTHHEYGEQEPLIRAAFIDYLRRHD